MGKGDKKLVVILVFF